MKESGPKSVMNQASSVKARNRKFLDADNRRAAASKKKLQIAMRNGLENTKANGATRP